MIIASFIYGQWGEIPHQLKLLRPGQKFDAVVVRCEIHVHVLIHFAFFSCNVFYFFSSSSLLLGTEKGFPVVLITEGRKVSRQKKPPQSKLSVGDIVEAKYVTLNSWTCTSIYMYFLMHMYMYLFMHIYMYVHMYMYIRCGSWFLVFYKFQSFKCSCNSNECFMWCLERACSHHHGNRRTSKGMWMKIYTTYYIVYYYYYYY